MNIIVRMPNWLGDLVMATPILADLRKTFENANITSLCQSNIAPLLQEDPNIDDLLSFHRPSGWIRRVQHDAVIEMLEKGKYDLGILLTNSFSSAWWFWRGKVKERIGFAGNGRSFLLTKAVPFPENYTKQHLVESYKELLKPLGIPISDTSPRIYLSQEEVAQAKERFVDKPPILVGINPGAAFGPAKCWLKERFQEVAKRLIKDPNVGVIFFGDPGGVALVDEICAPLPKDRVMNLAGKTTLREFLSLVSLCSAFLSNDSGPMHVAAALKVPLIALFGSTDEVRSSPYQWGKVIHKHVECSPCHKKVCPIDFRCMTRIEVDEVYNAIRELIDAKKRL